MGRRRIDAAAENPGTVDPVAVMTSAGQRQLATTMRYNRGGVVQSMAVARARGIKPVGFNGFDPAAFAAEASSERSRASIAALAEFNRHTAKTHSGIYRDLAVRKRRTEIDPQIGIIAELGREAGVTTPALARLVALIHDIEDGRRPMAFSTFQELIDTCTSASTTASRS